MKRRELLAHLAKNGCELFREGAKHSLYWKPTTRATSTVPRHNEIFDPLARKICKDLGVPYVRP
jgi:mRNA interferase HicA